MVKKKGPAIVSKSNELVQTFANHSDEDFVINPVSYTQIRGNFSLAQTSLMIGIIGQLQDRIRDLLTTGQRGSLFPADEVNGNLINIEIPLKELGISAKKYGELEAACEALLHVDMSYKRFDEKTKVEYNVKQNIFHKIEFPTADVNSEGEKIGYKSGQRRKGSIRIQMVDESAREILNLRKGYTKHLKYITSMCRSPRTPRLYMYLIAWRKVGCCTVNYIDLKEFFGVLTFSKDHKRIIDNKYEKYGAFCRDVLKPVMNEMKKLSDANKVEFYFEYEPIYPKGVTRGDPESIRFHLISSQFGTELDNETNMGHMRSDMITKYGLQPMEWERLEKVWVSGIDVKEELRHIDELIEQRQPDNVHAYVTEVLYNWLVQQKPQQQEFSFVEAEEIKDEPERPTVSKAIRDRYDWWMEQCKTRLGEEFWNTYMAPGVSDLWSYNSRTKTICVAVPSDFVQAKWEEHLAEVSTYFFTAFGKDARLGYEIVDLSLF